MSAALVIPVLLGEKMKRGGTHIAALFTVLWDFYECEPSCVRVL